MNVGFEARVASINAAGGIDGHKIVYRVLYDDSGSPTTDLADIQQLILEDHVFAIGPVASVSLTTGDVAYAAAHHVPMMGYDFTETTCNTPWFFGLIQGGCETALPKVGAAGDSEAFFDAFAQATHRKLSSVRVAIVQPNGSANVLTTEGLEQTAKQLGAHVVYADDSLPQIPPVDFTPYVQPVLNTHPNLLVPSLGYSEELGFDAAAKANGYSGALMSGSGLPANLFAAGNASAPQF